MAMKYLETMMTESVLRAQQQYYGHAAQITDAPERDLLGEGEAEFLAARDSFYLSTVSETGWPYVQHRGGPKGFLRLLNPSTLVFADYQGNRQLLSTGNLSTDDRVSLFLMDYANRARLKILGHARVEDAHSHPDLAVQLANPSMKARVERIVFIDVTSSTSVEYPLDVVLYRHDTFDIIEHRFQKEDLVEISSWWQSRIYESVEKLPSRWIERLLEALPRDTRSSSKDSGNPPVT
ncbi:MAG: pyridoxamine 5'-phosphate oxidase family protein [Nitrospira sp.]|nr:pyridoxamine 5'-phosphate oxidase family protein [Nitrospira sp.]